MGEKKFWEWKERESKVCVWGEGVNGSGSQAEAINTLWLFVPRTLGRLNQNQTLKASWKCS